MRADEQARSGTRVSLKLASEKSGEDGSALSPAAPSLLSALSPLRRMVQGVLFSAFSA